MKAQFEQRDPDPYALSAVSGASRFVQALHAVLLAVSAAVFAHEMSLVEGVAAAAAGAFAGSLLAERLHRGRVRAVASVGLSVLGLAVAMAIANAVASSRDLAVALGPTAAMAFTEVVRWGLGAFTVAAGLRAAALAYRAALAVEGALAVLVVSSVVAAHRDGMIARPLEISDWFWRQGIDPVVAFLGVGLGAAFLLAGVLASGRSGRRTVAQLLAVLLLGLGLVRFLHEEPLSSDVRNASGRKLGQSTDDPRAGPASAGAGGAGKGEKGKSSEDDALPPPPKPRGGQNRPTAIVIFQRDVAPFGDVFYFRHAAFSQFNGVRLVEATAGGLDPDARYARFGDQDVPGVHNDALARARVATDVAILSQHSRTFGLIDATRIEPRPNPEPARFRRAYRVISTVPTATVSLDALLGMEPGDPAWDDRAWKHYTRLPRDERYHDLAGRLQVGLRPEYRSDPVALAFAVKQYLEENTIYSFARRYEGDDPTGAFLFSEDKRGYCVHLAHAGAYLLRALGVPTRVSAGYAVPAANLGRGSALLVKDGDAHAWAEIYLRGIGWIPIEITPLETDIKPAPFEEQDLQQLLGEMARKQGRFEREATGPNPWVARLLAVLGLWQEALLLLLVLAASIKTWRLCRPLLTAGDPAPKVAYRAAADVLSGVGWVRDRGESRERFARRVAEHVPGLEPLTGVLMATALGSAQPTAAAGGKSLAGVYLDIFAQTRASVPAWRFWLGLLNPVSWLWSR